MNVIDSQLTKVYLVPTTTAVATAANCVTAIATAKELLCFQTFGEIGVTYGVQTYKCIDQNAVKKSRGSADLGNIPVEFLFDPADTAGQAELRAVSISGERKTVIVKYNDQITPTTGNPTYRTFETFVSGEGETIALDAAIIAKYTMEICSIPARIIAT